ncbi:MAG: PfkB domain protein [Glaciihabitans sp.]|nr:PfkB domain protein [Glaciihabitans sp.]
MSEPSATPPPSASDDPNPLVDISEVAPAAAEVYVIGEALVDIVHLEGGSSEHPGGSPANVAYGLGLVGVPVTLLTHLGDDARGQRIRDRLTGAGVRLAAESMDADRTSTAAAEIDDTGAARYVFDIDWSLPLAMAIPPVRLIHTGSIATFLEPGATVVRNLIAGVLAVPANTTIVTYDPNIRPALVGEHRQALRIFEETARLATVVKLSDEDAEWLYPQVAVDVALEHILTLGPALAVGTLGGEGSVLLTSTERVEVPAAAVSVVDTIGAGDTYMASLIQSLLVMDITHLDSSALRMIGTRAALAAGITVSRAGSALPTEEEVNLALQRWEADRDAQVQA